MIRPGDTKAILEMGSDMACYVGSCTACELGKKIEPYKRTMGYGSRTADLMIVADDAVHASYRNPGALDIFTIGVESKEPREKFVPVHEVFLDTGFDPAEVYATTAFKCPLHKRTAEGSWRYDPGHGRVSTWQLKPCLTRHLGVEIEMIQPAVILCYGSYVAQFIATHFPLSHAPRFIPIRGQARISTPSSWRYDELLLVRSPKYSPRQQTHFNNPNEKVGLDLDNIRWAFETARDYLEHELDDHRR